MLKALSTGDGIYSKSDYESAFVDCFGYGGSYVGYIDHPTRDTLNNIIFAEKKALARIEKLPFNRDEELQRKLLTKVLGNAKQFSGEALKEKVEAAVRLTDDDDYLVEHALKIVEQWQSVGGYHGADDTQLPALSKLPALVAHYAQQENLLKVVESAIRVTNNNDKAVAVGQAAANMIETAITSGDPVLAIDSAKQELSGYAATLIDQALASQDKNTVDVTREWGMACQLNIGFPSAVHNIATATSFTDAIQKNIYAGGDSCGRSILIGAVMGACYGLSADNGIPDAWVDQLNEKATVLTLTENLLNLSS